jgi:hypothetical protein
MPLKKGDTIEVEQFEDIADDWVFGTNPQTGGTGWMPVSYLNIPPVVLAEARGRGGPNPGNIPK